MGEDPAHSTAEAAERHLAEVVCNDYIVPVIAVFGIVCNVINLVVLSRKSMKESPYSYLMALSVADLGMLVLSFLESVFAHHYSASKYFWQFFYCYIFFPVGNMFTNSSVWITVLLTVERWFSVKFPLKAKDLCTRTLARTATLCTGLAAIVINIPRFFCKRPHWNETTEEWESASTDFLSSSFYGGLTWFYTIIIHIIPFLSLFALNIYLLVLVYRARKHRDDLTQSRISLFERSVSREQTRLTVTCICIIVLFLVCIGPSAISQPTVAHKLFGQGQTPAHFYRQRFYRVLRVTTNLLVYLNLSLNFVFYCVFNNKFTRTLRLLVYGRNCPTRYPGRGRADACVKNKPMRSFRASTSSSVSQALTGRTTSRPRTTSYPATQAEYSEYVRVHPGLGRKPSRGPGGQEAGHVRRYSSPYDQARFLRNAFFTNYVSSGGERAGTDAGAGSTSGTIRVYAECYTYAPTNQTA